MQFREFLRYFHAQWQQGEHVTLIGPTGVGKSTLTHRLLTARDYVTVFATKDKDDTTDKLVKAGYKLQRGYWDGAYHDYIVLWPRGQNEREVAAKQYHYFNDAIDKMYKQGGWCLNFDEVSYMTDFLRMDRKMRWLLQQGRSSGLSVVAATQRPAFIPLAFYDMPSWLIFWNENDERNLKRIQGIGGVDGRIIKNEVTSLQHREILCVHNRHPYERIRTFVRV